MAELFQTSQQNVSLHLLNIHEENEMQREATHKGILLVRQEGQRAVKRPVDFYNLDAIISVGHRVKSVLAIRFRIWATQRLREHIVKGFVLDDERLKNPDQPFDYLADYVLVYRNIKLAVNDAKAWDKAVTKGVDEVDDVVGAAVLPLAVGKDPVEPPPFRGLAGVIFEAAAAKSAGDLIAGPTFSQQSRERLDLAFGEWRDGVHISDAHGLVNRAGLSSAGVACSLPDGKPY